VFTVLLSEENANGSHIDICELDLRWLLDQCNDYFYLLLRCPRSQGKYSHWHFGQWQLR